MGIYKKAFNNQMNAKTIAIRSIITKQYIKEK